MTDSLCPCGSGKIFSHCCLVYINGLTLAPTPEVLMRSRYSAYVMQNVDYLWQTWHPDTRCAITPDDIKHAFIDTQWLSLKVIACNDEQSTVEFIATYNEISSQREFYIHERSRFSQQNGKWFYVDGIKPEVKRNALCPCGSGKKYKKCCFV